MRYLFLLAVMLVSSVNATPVTTATVHCLANAMYYEARGEGERGMLDIGQTVMNRVARPQWPNTVCRVVYQPAQITGIWTADYRHTDAGAWRQALVLAAKLLQPQRYDLPNHGADHYVTRALYKQIINGTTTRAPWVKRLRVRYNYRNHVFMV